MPAGQRVKGFFNVKSCGNQHRGGVFIQGLCLNSAEQRWVCMVQRTSKETKQHRRNQQSFEVKESPNSSPAAEQGGITDKNQRPLHPGATLSSGGREIPRGEQSHYFRVCKTPTLSRLGVTVSAPHPGNSRAHAAGNRARDSQRDMQPVGGFMYTSLSGISFFHRAPSPPSSHFNLNSLSGSQKRPIFTPSRTSAGPVMS